MQAVNNVLLLQFLGNIQLLCSGGMTNYDGLINFCNNTYYYCRCEVVKSSQLTWSVNGVEEITVIPGSKPSDFPPPHDPLNILIQSVDVGAREDETNFTSLLWLHSNYFLSNTSLLVECASAESQSSITFKPPGKMVTIT